MKILKKAYDSGLRTFDTADCYSNGSSEILLGKFIRKYNIPRDRVVILSKVYFPVSSDPSDKRIDFFDPFPTEDWSNSTGLSRKHIFDAIENSVRRLGTYIDVLQIHRFDPDTPKKEIMKALHDVVNSGQARYIGASSMKAIEFAQLQFVAEQNNWTKFISMQNYYNLIAREEEREMIPFCNDNEFGKVGLIPWSPLARGYIARPFNIESEYGRNASTDEGVRQLGYSYMSTADITIVNRVEEIAIRRDCSMAVIATNWVMCKGAIPIVGINSEARVDDLLKAFTFKLTDNEIRYLEEPYEPKVPYV